MHAIVIRRKNAIHSQVAENRARQCMLALSELAKSWPVAGWISRLFISLMTRLTGHSFDIDPRLGSSAGPATSSAPPPPQSSSLMNGLAIPEQQQNYQTNSAVQGFESGKGVSHSSAAEAPWPEDLGSGDLDWIFQESLGGFNLYDFSGFPTEPLNLAFSPS